MTTQALPPVVSQEDWLAARKQLLAKEKEATKARDRINAAGCRWSAWTRTTCCTARTAH